MPLRRWLLLLTLLTFSFVVSVLPLLYVLLVDPDLYARIFTATRPPRGVPLLQLLEPLIDYGLLRLRYWGWLVGLPYFAPKGVYAGGLAIGMALGGQREALLFGLPLAALWSGIALFLYINKADFDG